MMTKLQRHWQQQMLDGAGHLQRSVAGIPAKAEQIILQYVTEYIL
jgi:hypothetical protein